MLAPTADGSPATLGEALDRAGAAATPLAFLDRRERRTETSWREVRARAAEVAGGLKTLGVAPADRVGLVYPTGPEFFHAFFGALLAGAVPVPLYPPVRLGRVEEYRRRTASLLDRVGARVLLADPRGRRVLVTGKGGPEVPLGAPELTDLASPADPREEAAAPRRGCEPHHAHPDDLALVQFSSGTTSDPKPAALSHRALLAQVEALNRFWPEDDGPRHAGVSWLPLYHDMGLIGCMLAALARPGPLTLMPPELFVARPAAWLRAISTTRATVSPAPSFAFGHCVERIREEELEGVDLSCWRFALVGAERVVPEVLDRFCERFARWGFRRSALMPGYGLAEAALAVTFARPGRGPVSRRFARRALAAEGRAELDAEGTRITSLGPPLPGFAVEVRDDEGRSLGAGEIGRVWVAGPSLMNGYLGDPDATRKALVDGWLDTGDLGFLFEEELYLTGRARDLLIIRGRNHAPEEVERAAERVEAVAPGGAAAASRSVVGAASESLVLLVEPRRGVDSEAAGLAEACRREVLAITGLAVDEVVVVPSGELPRTSSGKIRRRAALERYLAGGFG